MIRIFFVAAGMALVAGLVFSPVAIVPVFFVVFAMVSFLNLWKLKCPYCRKRVKLDAKVCHHCGREVKSFAAKLAASQSAARSVSVQSPQSRQGTAATYCSSCGAMLAAAARFCSSCGASVHPSLGGHAGAAN